MKKLMAAACLILMLSSAWSQALKNASTEQLVDMLAPQKPLTRSLRNLVPESRSVDLVIQFNLQKTMFLVHIVY